MNDSANSSQQAIVGQLFGSLFGNVDQKIEVCNAQPAQPDQTSSPQPEHVASTGSVSPVRLSKARGTKIDLIRVINCLYELGFFTDEQGGRICKKEVMVAIGQAVGVDLTNYDNDLSRTMSDATSLDRHMAIFERLTAKMQEIYEQH